MNRLERGLARMNGTNSVAQLADYDPVVALGAGLIVLMVGIALFWPQIGLVGRWRRNRRASARVQAEDALKHLCKCEMDDRRPTMVSLAGALQVTQNQAAEVIEGLQERDLVVSDQSELSLTPEGRRYAMNIIRAHRLWEQHLAERTGLAEAEWHDAAEKQEHRLTEQQTEALAASLGNPTHDPHGDPIPTAEGEIVSPGGRSLASVEAGHSVRITHIEDEPEVVYAQLVAMGLYVGQVLRVTETDSTQITFWADGEERRLAPLLGANVTVRSLDEDVARHHEESGPGLNTLPPGAEAVVQCISPLCRGPERRRLLDLGILPGTRVRAEMRSPGGDPTAYRIRETLIALREEQARMILLQSAGKAS